MLRKLGGFVPPLVFAAGLNKVLEYKVFAFLSCWFVLLMPLGSNSVEIEETCAKPFLFLIGLGMFFNSMNLDLINGGRHFGSRFQGLLVI